jgi:hypothetical protein
MIRLPRLSLRPPDLPRHVFLMIAVKLILFRRCGLLITGFLYIGTLLPMEYIRVATRR